jgi:hypothetical protein
VMSVCLGTGETSERQARWVMLCVLLVILVANGAYSGLVSLDIRPTLMIHGGR